jgi:hypothetical protein
MATTHKTRAEWIDAATARQQFGLTRSVLFHLRKAGQVVSSSVKTPGKSRGKRLYQVASLKGVIMAGVGK